MKISENIQKLENTTGRCLRGSVSKTSDFHSIHDPRAMGSSPTRRSLLSREMVSPSALPPTTFALSIPFLQKWTNKILRKKKMHERLWTIRNKLRNPFLNRDWITLKTHSLLSHFTGFRTHHGRQDEEILSSQTSCSDMFKLEPSCIIIYPETSKYSPTL